LLDSLDTADWSSLLIRQFAFHVLFVLLGFLGVFSSGLLLVPTLNDHLGSNFFVSQSNLGSNYVCDEPLSHVDGFGPALAADDCWVIILANDLAPPAFECWMKVNIFCWREDLAMLIFGLGR
jgi:hypothetical protein